MWMYIQTIAKMLNKTDCTDVSARHFRTTCDKSFTNLINYNLQDCLKDSMRLKVMPNPHRKTYHELTHRYAWNNVLYQICCGFTHSSSVARGTNPSSATRKCYEELLAAILTARTCKSFCENAAPKKASKLLVNILRNRIFSFIMPSLVVLFDNLKKNGLFWPARPVYRLRLFMTANCYHASSLLK